MKRTLGHFVPIAFCVCVLSVGLLLCGSAVAKGATVVEKATAGQVNLLTSEMVQPSVVLPDIAGALTPAIALVPSSLKSSGLNKTVPATNSPPVVQDFECATTHVVAPAPDIGATHQPVLSVVRT